jgi:hypothetical protein
MPQSLIAPKAARRRRNSHFDFSVQRGEGESGLSE